MRNLRAIALISIILLSTPLFPNLFVVEGQTANASYFLRSTVRYNNPSQNDVWNFTERGDYDRTIGLFMNNSWQTVELVNSTLPIEEKNTDDDGNSVCVLRFPGSALLPGENVSFTLWYRIVAKPRDIPAITESESQTLSNVSKDIVSEYTGEEGSWLTGDLTLRELAHNLTGSETRVLTIVKNFIAWIKDHIRYPSQGTRHEIPYYPNQTYVLKEGDCDDQAILLITLCRIIGIPAYLQIGCIYMPRHFDEASIWNGHVSFVERRVGWHGWALVYIPPWGWLPVDLTYVTEGHDDPLNAIKHGAVTLQNTSNYMNIIHSDYVGASLETRDFLSNNGFQVYTEDEMIQDVKPYSDGGSSNVSNVGIDSWVPFALILLTALVVVTSILIVRHLRTRKVEQTMPRHRHTYVC